METNNFFGSLPLEIKEISGYMGGEHYFIVRQELNKFMMYANRSEYCPAWQDSVHNLYISLFHLENLENALLTSDLSEELIHQSKIVAKLQVLKMAILDTIDEIQTEFAR